MYDIILDCIVVGEKNVGKTTLVNYICNNEYNCEYSITIGVDFFVYRMKNNNRNIKLNIWDTAGQETFRSITKTYFIKSAISFIVFDFSSNYSFFNIDYWYNEIKQHNPNSFIVLIGNKIDKEYRVNKNIALEWAREHNCMFIECSLKKNIANNVVLNKSMNNIKEIFKLSVEGFLEKYDPIEDKSMIGVKKIYSNETSIREEFCASNNDNCMFSC